MRATLALPSNKPVSLYGDLGWQRTFGDTKGQTSNRFANANPDVRFTVRGAAIAKNTAKVGAGVQAQLTHRATLNLGYQGQFGANTRNHAANLQIKVRF